MKNARNIKKLISVLLILVTVLSLSSPAFAAVEVNSASGDLLKQLGILTGDASGRLNESAPLKREELVAILIRMADETYDGSFVKPSKPSFTDVPTTHWSFEVVEKAKHYGLTTGIGGGKFGLGQEVSYEQGLTFVTRLVGLDLAWDNIKDLASAYEFAAPGVLLGDKFSRGHMFELATRAIFYVDYHAEYTAFWGDFLLKRVGKSFEFDYDKSFALKDVYLKNIYTAYVNDKFVTPLEPTAENLAEIKRINSLTYTPSTIKNILDDLKISSVRENARLSYSTGYAVEDTGYGDYVVAELYTGSLHSETVNTKNIELDIVGDDGYGLETLEIQLVKKVTNYSKPNTVAYLLIGVRGGWVGVTARVPKSILIEIDTKTGYIVGGAVSSQYYMSPVEAEFTGGL